MELQRYLPYYFFINHCYCCRDIIHVRGCREEIVVEMMTVVSLVTRQPLRVIGSAIKDNGEPRYRESEGRKKKKRTHGSPHSDVWDAKCCCEISSLVRPSNRVFAANAEEHLGGGWWIHADLQADRAAWSPTPPTFATKTRNRWLPVFTLLSQQSISLSCWKIDNAALMMPTTHDGNYAQILVHHQTHLDAKDALLIPLPSFPISWCVWRYKKQKKEIVVYDRLWDALSTLCHLARRWQIWLISRKLFEERDDYLETTICKASKWKQNKKGWVIWIKGLGSSFLFITFRLLAISTDHDAGAARAWPSFSVYIVKPRCACCPAPWRTVLHLVCNESSQEPLSGPLRGIRSKLKCGDRPGFAMHSNVLLKPLRFKKSVVLLGKKGGRLSVLCINPCHLK